MVIKAKKPPLLVRNLIFFIFGKQNKQKEEKFSTGKEIINQHKVNLDTTQKEKKAPKKKSPGKICLTSAWHLSRPLLGGAHLF